MSGYFAASPYKREFSHDRQEDLIDMRSGTCFFPLFCATQETLTPVNTKVKPKQRRRK